MEKEQNFFSKLVRRERDAHRGSDHERDYDDLRGGDVFADEMILLL